LLMMLLLPLLAIGCRQEDKTPPDVIKQITMKKWEIFPNRIEVPQGEEIELVVNSTDVEHGIAILALGVSEPVQPGRPTIVKFRAKKPGTYAMRCSVLCGRGHNQMTGELVITPVPTH
jgi:cytochrome c oxidase subunit II